MKSAYTIAVHKSPIRNLHVISFGGKEVGFVTKFKDTKTEKHPWQAFTIPAGIACNDLLGSFYAEDGGKKAAIGAVISNAIGGSHGGH